MKLFKFLVGFVALGTAGCAAFFSVLGIATFLGGNFTEVAIMASFLEAGKLICASAAYRFRKVAPLWVRFLLVTFTLVMMAITSMGIFGYLSDGYQEAASKRDVSEQRIKNVQSKKKVFQKRAERLKEDRRRLIATQSRLDSISSEQGWLTERQDQRLSKIPPELNEIEKRLSATRDSVLTYEQKATNLQATVSGESKLGPILFVAQTVGLPQNEAAFYFIGLLMLVFDPMAVTLVVALSMATDFEETVEETKEETDENGETVINYDPTGKKVDPQEIRETLSKPLPEKEEKPESEKKSGPLSKTNLDPYSQGVVDNATQTAESILNRRKKDGSDVLSSPEKLYENQDPVEQDEGGKSEDQESKQPSGNKPESPSLDEEQFYEEPPPEEKQTEERGGDDFKEWIGEEEEQPETRDQPWKESFKKPFN